MSCPCCSGKQYTECCKVYHDGQVPQNALHLMKSRFSAYAMNLPAYIVSTTHPANPQYMDNHFNWKREISQFSKITTFQRLEILDAQTEGEMATVTFVAHLLQEGKEATFTERSYFQKRGERWLYLGGNPSAGNVPELAVKGPFRLLPLTYYGDPILSKKGSPVTNITPEIKALVEKMIETMDVFDGIGLAAPQVNQSLRLFVMRVASELEDGKLDWSTIKIVINPSYKEATPEKWSASEGCLSIPGLRSDIERSKDIDIEYTTLQGEIVRERLSGWAARVFQHEYDHIDGVLYPDRMSPEDREKITPALNRLKSRLIKNQ